MKKRKNVFWNRSKKDQKIYYVNHDLKRPKIQFISLIDFLENINFGLTSKNAKNFDISNIWFHTRIMKFQNHFKFFSDLKDAENYLNKLNNLKRW